MIIAQLPRSQTFGRRGRGDQVRLHPGLVLRAAHEAVKELMGTALAKAREAGEQDKAHYVPLEAAGRIAAESY